MLILASKSPRRRELMEYMEEEFEIASAEVDESYDESLSPAKVVEYLSCIKAMPFKNEKAIVIGADTVVAIDGKILGKPKDEEDAFLMLKTLSGKEHKVYTGVTLIKGEEVKTFSVETKVYFYPLTDNEIKEYIKTGEPMDKAGSYGIQGKGCLLIEKIDGDYFNVVGLPVSRVKKELDTMKGKEND